MKNIWKTFIYTLK